MSLHPLVKDLHVLMMVVLVYENGSLRHFHNQKKLGHIVGKSHKNFFAWYGLGKVVRANLYSVLSVGHAIHIQQVSFAGVPLICKQHYFKCGNVQRAMWCSERKGERQGWRSVLLTGRVHQFQPISH